MPRTYRRRPPPRRLRWHLAALPTLLLALCAGCSDPDPVAEVRRLHAAGSFAASLEPLRELLILRPEDPEVNFLYGLALTRSGAPTQATWSLRKAMESPEWLVPAGLQLASGAVRSGNPDLAIETLDRVLEVEPESSAALVLRSMARSKSRRDYEGALADADRALEIDPDLVDALAPRAVALLGLEREEEAEAALRELESRFGGEGLGLETGGRFCAVRASFAKEKGDIEEADRLYQACLEASPAGQELVDGAVEFYDAQGRPDRSVEVLRGAVEAAPLARGFRVALVRRLADAGEAEEAEALLRRATGTEHTALAADAWVDLGGYLVELEDYEAAVAAFERVLETGESPAPQLLFAYADALLLSGRHDRALEVAGEMEVAAHREVVRGRVLLERGEPAEALQRLDAGLAAWPNNAVVRYYAARAAERLGDFDRAIDEYRYAVRIDPLATDALLRLVRLYLAQGSYPLALAVVRQYGGGQEGQQLEFGLIELRILARLGQTSKVPARYAGLVARELAWGRALAALAQGARERAGPAAAVRVLREAEQLDLTHPDNAPALEALVVHLADAGSPQEGLAPTRAALEAHPENAVLHAIRGLALERSGAPAAEVGAAYQRSLELGPETPLALEGLARLRAAEGDAEAALALYARAVAARPEDLAVRRGEAELLVAMGRPEDAERSLESLLEEHPYDAAAALELARLRRERGADPSTTRELERRARRFGGSGGATAARGKPSPSEPGQKGTGAP